ncbi:MAG: hypothetical protein IT290_05050 [Deltaproteobacteria bacterium]|nr:hypothetical protein [Deltaproteobacteria bacterium]
MANVNLKVIMRVGDNRTAEDMSEWIGMVKTAKKSLAAGISTSLSAREWTKHIEINKKSADAHRDGVTVAEDEEELVSTEELKHEMSAEKGLAWFDKGDGVVRKGRAVWFDSELPGTWEGREFLTKYESVEADEIGLAEWVDEHIFSIEEAETEREARSPTDPFAPPPSSSFSGGSSGSSGSSSMSSSPTQPSEEEPEDTGPFRLNPFRPFRGRTRANTVITRAEPKPELKATPEPVLHNTEVAAAESVAVPRMEERAPAPLPDAKAESKGVERGAAPSSELAPQNGAQATRPKQDASRRDERGDRRDRPAKQERDRAPVDRQNSERPSERKSGGPTGGGQPRASQANGVSAPANAPRENRRQNGGERVREGNDSAKVVAKEAPKGDGGGQKPHKQDETKPAGANEQFRFKGSRRDTIVHGKKVSGK